MLPRSRGHSRRGNVEVVCRRYNVPTVPDLPALIAATRATALAPR